MTSQTTTNTNLLTELTKKYEDDLGTLSDDLLLPDGYQLSISRDSDGSYSLSVYHLDSEHKADFFEDVVTGTTQQIADSIEQFLALQRVKLVAERHLREVVKEKMALDAASQSQEWHSHYESLDKPKLTREPFPGWVFESDGMFPGDGVTVFRSEEPDFGTEFTVIDRPDGTQEVSFQPGGRDWIVDDVAEILELSDKTDRFQVWLNDCATITTWIKNNAKAATK